jgi:chloramphenicol O-acetyltransferase type A
MEVFDLIDIDSWPRKFYFDHYYQHVKFTYSFVASIDISNLLPACKQHKIKLYPVMLYIISRAVNEIKELHIDVNEKSQVGLWNFVSPCYTVFHEDEKTFSNIWTRYNANFSIFYRHFLHDIEQYGQVKEFIAKPNDPGNTFPVSCAPWLDFTAFNLNIYDDARYLKPIFTIGKYTHQEGKIMVPLAIQCHHALCDGYHAGLLLENIRNLAASFEQWMLIEQPSLLDLCGV